VATEAGDLPCRWVIHTVGPNWYAGERDPALLESCFTSSLAEAERVGARTVALPAVSAGVYGWDAERVAEIAVGAVRRHEGTVDLARFVLFSSSMSTTFSTALARG